MVQEFKLYSHPGGPNPWKVAITLTALGLPYSTKYMDFSTVKDETFTKLNPNGRVPALEDPNTGLVLWESAAIVEYLIEKYDTKNELTYAKGSDKEKWEERCWVHFQMSGQGPYFGQKAWFSNYHPEKLPSAIERYTNEINRVLSVIDSHLSKTNRPYLIGDKVSYADLLFVPWNAMICGFLLDPSFDDEWKQKYPKAHDWHQRLVARDDVKKCLEERQRVMKEGH